MDEMLTTKQNLCLLFQYRNMFCLSFLVDRHSQDVTLTLTNETELKVNSLKRQSMNIIAKKD